MLGKEGLGLVVQKPRHVQSTEFVIVRQLNVGLATFVRAVVGFFEAIQIRATLQVCRIPTTARSGNIRQKLGLLVRYGFDNGNISRGCLGHRTTTISLELVCDRSSSLQLLGKSSGIAPSHMNSMDEEALILGPFAPLKQLYDCDIY